MSQRINLELEPADTERLANLCGQFDEHLKQIESRLQVDIFCPLVFCKPYGHPAMSGCRLRCIGAKSPVPP